jgi:hypothetical protein
MPKEHCSAAMEPDFLSAIHFSGVINHSGRDVKKPMRHIIPLFTLIDGKKLIDIVGKTKMMSPRLIYLDFELKQILGSRRKKERILYHMFSLTGVEMIGLSDTATHGKKLAKLQKLT